MTTSYQRNLIKQYNFNKDTLANTTESLQK